MKTTIRARILRLSIISVSVMGVTLTLIALIMSYFLSVDSAHDLTGHSVSVAHDIIHEESLYVGEELKTAQVSNTGDALFNKVYMNGDSVGYDYSSALSESSDLESGEIYFSHALLNEKGETVILAVFKRGNEVVIGELEGNYFIAAASAIKSDDEYMGYVVDCNGNIVVSGDSEEVIAGVNASSDLGLDEVVKAAVSGSGTINVSSDKIFGGDELMYSYDYLNEAGVGIIYGIKTGVAMETFYIMAIALVIFVGTLLTVAIYLSLKVSGKVATPVRQTAERLDRFSKGDLDSECIISKRGDETEVLTYALQDTVNALSMYINDIKYILAEIGNGNLTVKSDVEYVGGFVEIKNSLDQILTNLSGTISDIQQTSAQVMESAQMLSDGAQNVAATSSKEAAALEEISSMTADITNRITENHENTNSAAVLLDEVVNTIDDGIRTMGEMNTSMGQIKTYSDEIQKIIRVIDDIAFQTNILALNAAVEAARAGNAGKGFAVVADEVRNLANKSAEAAKNTISLVNKSAAAVEQGNTFTVSTSESLNEVNNAIKQFSELMNKIAEASSEQKSAIDQINAGFEQITDAVQSNSATAQESAASSEELRSMVHTLNDRVEAFRI